MKVIGHKTPGKNIGKWFNVIMHFSQEVQIVFFFIENHLPVIALVKYVVDVTWLEMHDLVFWFLIYWSDDLESSDQYLINSSDDLESSDECR
ncbi:MAG: hypothetical protein EA393_15445 [Bacteroidetes bacterium]|nr:MAG: hypothetical protein EA393_15445 [Bacteroidota bacterium]